MINRAIKNAHWALDSTYNFTAGFNQILIIMYLDQIINKSYPLIMVLMSDKNIDAYKKIFKNILEYIKSNFDREKFKLETFCTDYEEAMITAFKNIFEKVSDKLHYIGCYIHYL